MKVSLAWLSDYVRLPQGLTAADLAQRLTMATVEVEQVTDLARQFERVGDSIDDTILEIDNKSLTNRPDLWGHYGIARELAAIFQVPHEPLPGAAARPIADTVPVRILAEDACRRYSATRIVGASRGRSPLWLESRLLRVGQRPISLLVDLTNYVMFALGQPCHVFDADKIEDAIDVRFARAGESIELLDGQKLGLDEQTLVIADQAGPLALAGVIGGTRAAVDERSSNIVLEVAHFEPAYVRSAALRFGVRTESSMRFEKSLDPHGVGAAKELFVTLATSLAPDVNVRAESDVYPRPPTPQRIALPAERIEERLGVKLDVAEAVAMLERLGFAATVRAGVLDVEVPSFRATGDVSIPEDLLEEIARLHGYDRLPFVPPVVRLTAAVRNPRAALERGLREYLAFECGMREVMGYPWVEDRYLEAAGLASEPCITLAAPPAVDARRLRPSLVPGLLKATAENLRYFQSFRIFELARVYRAELVTESDQRAQLPCQPKHVAAALVGRDVDELFLAAKGMLEQAHRAAPCEAIVSAPAQGDVPWADPASAVSLYCGDRVVGTLGVVHGRALRLASIKHARAVVFELDLEHVVARSSRENRYVPVPEYPQVRYDLAMVFSASVRWSSVSGLAAAAHPLVKKVELIDEFSGDTIPEGKKSLALRLELGSEDRTLSAEEAQQAANAVLERLTRELGGVLRA